MSCIALVAAGCADFGSAARTFAILWNQHRCSLVCGNTSRSAVEARRFRTQEQNRADARERLRHLLQQAAEKPKPRKATKPTRASVRRRLDAKSQRSGTKARRGRVDLDSRVRAARPTSPRTIGCRYQSGQATYAKRVLIATGIGLSLIPVPFAVDIIVLVLVQMQYLRDVRVDPVPVPGKS